jgi:hypothetical protein
VSTGIGYINAIGSCIAIWGYSGIDGHRTPTSSPSSPKVFALQTNVRPALLNQQATRSEGDGIVVEAGVVHRCRLDQAIAPHECSSATTGENRRWAFPRSQSLVRSELEVEGEAVCVKTTRTIEHVS